MDEKEQNITEIKALKLSNFSTKINDLFQSPKTTKFFEVCFFALLCYQIGMIIYINLFQNQYHIGFDASSFMLNSIEAWKQKTVFTDNWIAQTSLALDSPMPLAALLYGITGNVFVAYGMVNIIFLSFFIFIIIDILRKIKISVLSSLLVLNFLFTPYLNAFFNNANPLDYFSLMFVSGGMYSIKIIICVLVLDSVLTLEIRRKSIINNLMMAVSVILVFTSGLSSGFYVTITILLPCFAYLFIKALRENDCSVLFNSTLIYILSLLIVAFIGKYIAEYIIGFTSNENNMVLIGANDFWKNIGSIVLGFFMLMGGLTLNSNVEIFSKAGISILINWALIVVVFASIIYCIYDAPQKGSNKKEPRSIAYFLIFSVLFINLLVFVLSYTTYGAAIFEVRYLIPLFIMLCFIVGIANEKINISLFKTTASIAVLVVLVAANILSFHYYNHTKIEEHLFNIPEKVAVYDTPVVYGYGDDMTIYLRDLRVIDTSKVYKVVTGSGDSVYHWGDYTYYDDISEYSGKIVLLSTESSFENLPEYIKGQFVREDSSGNIIIYVSEKNCFDLKTGFPDKIVGSSEERAYSPGICIQNGEIGSDGCFYSNGNEGYVMYGPYASAYAGTYDIVLKYEIVSSPSDKIGTFDISSDYGTKIIQAGVIDANSNELILHNVVFDEDAIGVEYRVFVYDGVKIKIESIEIKHV